MCLGLPNVYCSLSIDVFSFHFITISTIMAAGHVLISGGTSPPSFFFFPKIFIANIAHFLFLLKLLLQIIEINIIFFFNFYFLVFRAAPAAKGSSQARGWIGATTAGLCQSHDNIRSEPNLQHTPQLATTLDP